jgi:hypothetical protein
MNGFNWLNIRSYNGSQNNAFEELVCQLAREEDVTNKAQFIRVGAPDGGVEAYCQMNDGSEYGWQAKYFFSVGDTQWRQLDQSFKTAINKHPNLAKYYVCIPLDRQEPRIDNQRWFMDKWNEHVKAWTKFAFDNYNRYVEFEYWGSSELITRLSQEKHIGTRRFWFESATISEEWLSDKLQESIVSLGKRYTPELNFELEIANVFDGIARDNAFLEIVIQMHRDMQRKIMDALRQVKEQSPIPVEAVSKIRQKAIEVQSFIENIPQPFAEMSPIDFDQLDSKCTSLGISLMECIEELEKLQQLEPKSNEKQNPYDSRGQKYDPEIRVLTQCQYPIRNFQEFLQSSSIQMVNTSAVVLAGEAGIGKSHLLADVAMKRMSASKPVLLLLGQHFTNDDSPWTQILRNQLRFGANEDEFLGMLNAKAQSVQCRMLIIVDAINEGRGKFFWKNQIRAFIRSIKKYKWLSLVLSVRASYEKVLIPEEVYNSQEAIRVLHTGFSDVEYEASKLFFENYNILQPSVPLLHPEFQNPLFLKLFCEGLNKAGMTVIPDGLEGITKIIDFYLFTINVRLSNPCRLDYTSKLNLVQKAIHAVVSKQVEKQCQYTSYEEANIVVGQAVQLHTDQWRGFLDELVKEGVFSHDIFWTSPSTYEEGVYFAYERFGDHIAVSYLLKQFLDKDNPDRAFQTGKTLHKYVEDEWSCTTNRGVVEALSIQLPEFVGKELYEVAPFCASYDTVVEAFVNSLLWRNTDTINEKVLPYINDVVMKNDWHERLFLDTILQVSSNPRHFFNGDSLHRNLMRRLLPERDAWWTVYINQNFGEQTAIKRLIDWAWTTKSRGYCSDEAIRLLAQTISWFLASSNRKLRDSATKALVCLLQDRIQVLEDVLRAFEDVDDPYVYERLFAVAYGCALRTAQKQKLPQLCRYIYDTIFAKQFVYPHILLRDYARNIVEYTAYLGMQIDIELAKVRPPYRSEWYKTIPSIEEIDREYGRDYKGPDFRDVDWAQYSILHSMTTEYGRGTGGYGDFGRYVFQSAVHSWEKDFDPQELSNIAIKRIFELGYDVELHGYYDRNKGGSFDRHEHTVERIGKKYQWIAFHEVLAKLSDHFKMSEVDYSHSETTQDGSLEFDLKELLAHIRGNINEVKSAKTNLSSDAKPVRARKYVECDYEGPWDPFVRDIDPSVIISKLDKERNYFEDKYEIPGDNLDKWVHDFQHIPSFEEIFFLNKHGRGFILLSSHLKWLIREVDEDFRDREELFIKTTALLVPEDKIEQYAASREVHEYSYSSNWESAYKVYGKEYYWSPAVKNRELDLAEKQGREMKTTTFEYLWEKGYDNSIEDSISYLMPSEFIVKHLGLSQDNNGYWNDEANKLVCYDMALEGYKTALLIERSSLEKLLKEHRLALIWDVYLEKIANRELHEWRFVLVLQNNQLRIEKFYGNETWSIAK